MKAFLLAAGRGERLRPLTDATPKCLVEIGGVPLLTIWLDLCQRHGITDVLVNTHHLAAQVESCVSGSTAGVHVRLAHEAVLLGTAGTIRANREFVRGERDFFILYADNLTSADLTRLRDVHRAHATAVVTMGLYPTTQPREKGIVVCDAAGWVRDYREKPAVPRSNLAHAGLLVASPQLFDWIPERTPVDLGCDVLPRLVGRSCGHLVTDYIRDIGTPENYRAAQAEWPTVVCLN